MTSLKSFLEANKPQLPPNMDAGMEFAEIKSIESNTFDLEGVQVEGMRIQTEKGEFKTSSKIIIEILKKYFATTKDPMTNVRVIAPRGKRYLTLEGF